MKGNRERIKYALRCPVAILGDGVSGRAAARLARSLGSEVEIYDEAGAPFGPLEAERAKVVVTSPGFSRRHPWLEMARGAGCAVVGELDFASASWPGEIIAVTGSNGKTTVTEFLTKVLREDGTEAVAAGNVGHPLSLAALECSSPEAVAVCEVSSFQAESLELFRPSSVLWTSFSEDHLDRHVDLHEYFEAKANLARRTSPDRLFLGEGVSDAAALLGRPYLKGFQGSLQRDRSQRGVPMGSPFRVGPQRGNYELVRSFCRDRGLKDEIVERVARNFSLPKHRFSKPIVIGDISFWNDSKATNFGATIAACGSFTKKALWIGGGQSKGGDLEAFCQRMKKMVRGVYLIGSSGPAMQRIFARMGTPVRVFATVGEAVKAAFKKAGSKADVLFSPGFSSYDQFSNFEDRGKCFENVVLDLKKLGEQSNRPIMA
ncbi:MAG: UDP-N-acetylmuramoyl-L-alanine--D-glutamate ligase [Opitutales bacterium]|nr:UDP-N-acetylmuramoyl-L-alanine--D-glutamate ligase [Opitutales bacterium]|tara:strand:- start:52 stop:1347 length:1296 start_codon:yes stop_codon:yes gene_type:complete